MSLAERMIKASTVKNAVMLDDSVIFKEDNFISTGVPVIDLALSGKLDGGFTSGLGCLAGPSKNFKSGLLLLMMSAFQKKYPEGIIIFYDSEFGIRKNFFEANNIDTSKVVHIPIANIEELKFDIITKLDAVEKGDRIMIGVDSIGNLASKKEVEDARDQKAVADMTRAKAIKSLFRMVTPYLTMHDIPMVTVNHTYQTQEIFSKSVISGGTGIVYSADWAFIVGRSQEKSSDEIEGYKFTINVEKSRYVREKARLPFTVYYDSGISKWSGMLDIALEHGYVTKPKNGWYTRPSVENDKLFREKDTRTAEFWKPIMTQTDFPEKVEKAYAIGLVKMMDFDDKEDANE